jgi:hypothetical protein
MLLRASSRAAGAEVDLEAAIGDAGGAGVPDAALLADFTDAVCRRRGDLDAVRSALSDQLGTAGLVEAAATVAVFNGLVRVADGCGIPLDDGAIAESDDFRRRLGIEAYRGAANTDPRRGDPTRLDGTVDALFR